MNRLFDFIKNKNILFIILAVGCAVILLIVGNIESDTANTDEIKNSEYGNMLEDELENIIFALTGCDEVSVMITLEGGSHYEYAVNTESGENSERVEYYSGTKENSLLLNESNPKVLGAAVICKGGDISSLESEITELVSRVLDIPYSRIYIGY